MNYLGYDGALSSFFNPKGIAIVGASREPNKPGRVILEIMLENKRKGSLKAGLYPVNPFADEILGLKCYKSILDVPDEVDLAVIVVPAKIVPKVLEECGKKGVKAAVVISAGFREVGNVELENELVRVARSYGIRVIGPNCIGLLVPETGVDTIFLPVYKELSGGRRVESTPRPTPGSVVLLTQSGAFGTAAIDYMVGEGLGLRAMVSYGNKADVDEADLLEFFGDDDATRAILMYVESLDRGRKVVEVARRVTLKKPIVALKAGRTAAGARAAASHTAALAGSDQVYEAAFRRAGIVRAYTVEELFDVAKALAMQPPSPGNRIGIVTDGGGAGVMTTDACELMGLAVPELKGETRSKLEELVNRGVIPRFASIANPIDLTGSASSTMYTEVLRVMLESKDVDLVIVLALHQVPGIEDPEGLAADIGELVRRYGYCKPVIAVDTGGSEAAVLMRKKFEEYGIPAYPTPERAATAARALCWYGQYLKRRGAYEEYISRWKPLA